MKSIVVQFGKFLLEEVEDNIGRNRVTPQRGYQETERTERETEPTAHMTSFPDFPHKVSQTPSPVTVPYRQPQYIQVFIDHP